MPIHRKGYRKVTICLYRFTHEGSLFEIHHQLCVSCKKITRESGFNPQNVCQLQEIKSRHYLQKPRALQCATFKIRRFCCFTVFVHNILLRELSPWPLQNKGGDTYTGLRRHGIHWAQVSRPPLHDLGEFLNFSKPQFSHLSTGDNTNTSSACLSRRWKKVSKAILTVSGMRRACT